MTDTYKRLSEPFPRDQLGTLNKGGAKLTYVPVSEVIARLNNVLGVSNWGITEMWAERDNEDPDWIVARTTLVATIDGETRTAIGFGGQKIKRTKNGDIVDLGDEYKGATSDALKKAAQQLGVGLDLARKDEALSYEADQQAPKASQEDIDAITAYAKKLEGEDLENFKDFWKKNVGVRLDSGKVTVEQAQLAKDNFGI